METEETPKLPVQLEKPLRDYKEAYLRYQELRKRPSTNVLQLDLQWKRAQVPALRIEENLITHYGKEAAERMIEQVTGWKTLPRVT